MQETQRKRLSDDLEIEVQPISPMKALRLFHKLVQAAAPAFGEAMKGGGAVGGAGNAKISDISLDNIGPAAAMLFDRFSADDLESTLRELLAGSLLHRDGKIIKTMDSFEAVFRGRPDLALAAGIFAVQVNFGPFWPVVREKLAALTAVAPKPVSAPAIP